MLGSWVDGHIVESLLDLNFLLAVVYVLQIIIVVVFIYGGTYYLYGNRSSYVNIVSRLWAG
jgi:hypothetical protein